MRLRGSTKSTIALLTVLVFMLSMVFNVLPLQAAVGDLTVTMTAPENQLGAGESVYQITNPINLDNIHFCWNFSNGIDTNLDSNLQQISLKTKSGESVALSKDDFVYTKEDTPVKLRQLELTLNSVALLADTDYIIELGSGITANNGTDTLDKTYSWEFKTGTVNDPEPPAGAAPTWPEGSKIETANIDATSMTLKWTAAQDTTGVTGYKIYQDGVEIGSVNGSTLYYDVSGLISATQYTFKVEAGNADGLWSQSGPSIQVITGGGGQLKIEQFSPPASEKSSSETQVYYTVNELIDPDTVHFTWNFSNGLNSNLIANLGKISLVKKSDNTSITLDRGNMTQEELDANTPDIVTLGEFKYTKQQTPKLRQIELICSQSLEPCTTYIIKISSDIQSNAGGKLGKNYLWEFTTTDPGDLTPPTWPEGKQLKTTRVAPNAVSLEWTGAQDKVIVAGYKILQDGIEVQTVDGKTTTCEIEGLAPNTKYGFKIEAVDGNGNQSTDGPSLTITTAEADTAPPTWPEGAELTITHAAAPALVLHWTEAVDNWEVAGYQVYQDGQLLVTVDNSTLKYHVTGLEINKSYNFMVKAVDIFNNCSESGPSLKVVLDREDNTAPIWPKYTSGSYVSYVPVLVEITVDIGWNGAIDDTGIFAYRIYQNDALIAEVDENTHNYSVKLPVDNQYYTFRIAAGDAAGNWGLQSGGMVVYTGDPNQDVEAPTWPADTVISASEINDSTLKIQWTEAEDNFWIEKYSILMDGNYVYSTNIGEDEGNPSFAGRTCLFDIKDCMHHGYPGLTPETLMPGTEHEFYIMAWDRYMHGKSSPKIKVSLGGSQTMGAALGPLGKKGFSIVAPECKNVSVDNITDINNRVINPVDPANVYFCWDFTTDLKPADDSMYIDNVILKNKLTGEIINLTPEDLVITQDDTPSKVRRVELKLKNALANQTTYILTLKKDFCGQSVYDGRLGRDYNWEFTTAVADSEKPTWLIGDQLTITETPTSLTLNWPKANDNVAVTGYEIVKTGNGNDEVLDTVDSKTTSYCINDLTVNTGYSFKVRARDYIGNWSNYLEVTGTTAETDTTCPTWDTKTLTCSEVAASSLVLNWQPAQDDWGVVAYAIYQNGQEIARVDVKDTTYTVKNLLPELEYNFKVKAGDAFNNWSIDGPELKVSTLTDTTTPTWPEGSTLTRTAVSSDSIILEWTTATDDVGVTAYKIFQNGTPVQDVEGNTTCTISGLTESSEYVFKVEAVDADGNCSTTGPSRIQWTTPQNAAPAGCRLAMGYYNHTLLLRDDGSLWVWGENDYGQLGDGTTTDRNQPVEITTISEIKSVAACHNHSIALKEDGTVWFWGNKTTLLPTQVSGLSAIIGIGAGDSESFAFDADGNIWTCSTGQAVKSGKLEGITAIAGGRSHTLALKNDRTVWAWGTNERGAIGTGNKADKYISPVEIPGLNGIVQIDAMVDNSAVVKADGTVWTFGQNQWGQLGDGTTNPSYSPFQVPNLTGVKAVAVAKYSMAALKNDGSVWGWGAGTEGDSRIPVQSVVSDISMLATGESATTVIESNGTIMAWSYSGLSSNPTKIGLFRTPVLNVASGTKLINQAVDISFEDNADWTTNISQITVNGVALNQDQYKLSTGVLTINAVVFDKAKDYTVVIKAVGYNDARITLKVMSEIGQETFAFDENTRNLVLTDQIAAATISCPAAVTDARISLMNFLPTPASGEETVTSTALPSLTVEAITSISNRPVKLEIPQGTTINAPAGWDGSFNVPTLKPSLGSVRIPDEEVGNPAKITCIVEIGANDVPLKLDHAVRILIPGQAGKEVGYCNAPYFTKITRVCAEDSRTWADANIPSGGDAKINVGNDLVIWTKHFTTFVTYYRAANGIPVIVNNLCAGGSHSMFLDSDGSLWTWGKNSGGVLGSGAITDRIVPMKAEGLDGFISVSAGSYHNMGLKADGTVWTWGSNDCGQLGYAEPASTDTPLQVPGLSDVASIMCGDRWSVAVKKDGTVWTWGYGAMGRLGNGAQTNSSTPVHVEGLTDIVSVATGGERNIAIKKDGTVWGWGRMLGTPKYNTYNPATTPIQLEGLTGVIAVDAGWGGQLAVKNDGTVWSWVRNTDKVLVPQQLDITDVKAISIKRGNAFAIKNDNTLWTWGKEVYTSPPTQVEGLAGIIAVDPSEYDINHGTTTHALALRGDGVIAAWGLNTSGQLGNGTNITSTTPVEVLFDKGTIAPQWPDKTLTSSSIGQNSLTLTWTPATDDVCTAIYRMYQKDQIIKELVGYTTTLNVTGLEAGTTYSFKVEACDGAKNWSSDGPVLEVTTVPVLVPDDTDNTLGKPVTITYTDNTAWRTAIIEITVDGVVLATDKYQIGDGTITINTEVFSEAKDYVIVVKATGYTDVSVTQTIIVPPVVAPSLLADATDNLVGQAVDITFANNADWSTAVTGITVDGIALDDTRFKITADSISISADVFTSAKNYIIVVKATGYTDASVTQTIIAAPGSNNANLASLETGAGSLSPGFSQAITNYTVVLPSETTMIPTITATRADIKATMLITPANALNGITTIKVTAEDGTVKTYSISFTVKQVIVIPDDLSSAIIVPVSATDKNFELPVIEPGNLAKVKIQMDIPSGTEGASISVPISSVGEQKSATLPKMEITSTVADISIPSGTTVSAPAGWDGTINAPTVKANDTVTVIPDAGQTATVSTVIEVGYGDIPLTFDKAVRIVIPGQAGKLAGYYRGTTFTPITRTLSGDTQAAADNEIPTDGEAKIDVGSDLVIWTKHFTSFVSYSQTSTSVDECFIATASFGSKFEPSVVLLRAFRDKFLLTNTFGQAFVEFYYKNSPPIAAYIANSEFLKAGVRGLLTPVVGVVYLLFHPGLLYPIISGLILLIVAMCFLKRRRVPGRV